MKSIGSNVGPILINPDLLIGGVRGVRGFSGNQTTFGGAPTPLLEYGVVNILGTCIHQTRLKGAPVIPFRTKSLWKLL